jgi:hypothetical protein
MLAGCGGSQPPIGAPDAMPQTFANATHAERGTSWMLPEAKSEDLLYVTNSYTVTVYDYPSGKHVGTLKHFYRPQGECSDPAGNVFIADGNTVQEYAHAGTKPIQSFSLSGYASTSCAVDSTTNDLAITWNAGLSSGYVAVYDNESGTPHLYTIGSMLYVFCGYDTGSNLFIDGLTVSYEKFAFVELAKGGSTLQPISLNENFQNPGAVQWDGKYLAVGDDEAQVIYRYAIAGSTAALKGTVNLSNAPYMYQWWIGGKKVVGSNEQEPDTTFYWSYPAGGQPIKSLQLKGIGAPFGATISKASK